MTPIAKVGLGPLFSFDFISPCYEKNKPKSRAQEIKYDSMSFYGQVRFDFRQFGKDDEMLKKQKPL